MVGKSAFSLCRYLMLSREPRGNRKILRKTLQIGIITFYYIEVNNIKRNHIDLCCL